MATGAKLLFRVKRDLRLPREKDLADGSYLNVLYVRDKDRRHKANGTRVRGIEYALEGIANAEPSYRLIANWLDVDAAPTVELAARNVVPRSKRPRLVEQEFYVLLLAHAAIRGIMTQYAAGRAVTSRGKATLAAWNGKCANSLSENGAIRSTNPLGLFRMRFVSEQYWT